MMVVPVVQAWDLRKQSLLYCLLSLPHTGCHCMVHTVWHCLLPPPPLPKSQDGLLVVVVCLSQPPVLLVEAVEAVVILPMNLLCRPCCCWPWSRLL